MTLSITHPVAILNVVELVLTIIIAGLAGNMACFIGTTDGFVKLQFISAIVYGYLMHSVVHVAQLFLPGTINKTTRLLVSACGSILWLAASALMLEAADQGLCIRGESYDRAIAGGILGLIVFLCHAASSFFAYSKLDDK